MNAETGTAATEAPAASSADPGERARRAEAALESALTERNRLWEQLHHRAANDRELEYYRNLTVALQASVSWRVTAPLRLVKRLFDTVRSLFGRLRRSN